MKTGLQYGTSYQILSTLLLAVYLETTRPIYCSESWSFFRRAMVARTAEAAEVPNCQHPPATVLLQPLQDQIPAAVLLTASLPQKEHV